MLPSIPRYQGGTSQDVCMNLTAAILAGGLGKRLRNVVADRPKVLAPVGDRPFLARWLDRLAAAGFHRIVLLTGHRAEQVREAFGETYQGMRLIYGEEPYPLGTAGAVRRALPLLPENCILLLNGDSYCEVRIDEFYKRHSRQNAGASLALVRMPDVARFGRVCRDRLGHITAFEEKGRAGMPGWINAGIYLIERELLAELPTGCPLSLERDVLPHWVVRRLVYGMACGDRFIDIGTPDSYSEAEAFFSVKRERSASEGVRGNVECPVLLAGEA
jgi:NDP-sugar pyrophosphorylase family protein